MLMELIDKIFDIQSNEDFEKVALEVYSFQKDNCTVYSEYLNALNKPEPANVSEIPFLPISFFKSHKVISGDSQEQVLFKSSGTSGERSQHFVLDTELYKKSFIAIYKDQIGDPKDQVILALLPNYLEQGESSLVYMVDELISYIKVETKKIGGSFRSPGMEAQCLKLIKETFKKHKVRL